jgi:hypothetical protein
MQTGNLFPFFCCGELNPEGCRSNSDTAYRHTGRSEFRFTEIVKLTIITFPCVRFHFATSGKTLNSLALVVITSFVIEMRLIVCCS